ncbi:MAG TPA: hypothetical protein VEL07_19240 [Planctomycetota bacterium]|nr:hypothetical protein [Planctomycetota bacterium]
MVAMQRRTWSLDEFGSGLDLRDGLFSDVQTRFRELTNLWVTKGRKIRRRPPCLREEGEFSANSQGLVNVDGQLYTFAKRGDTVTHTGAVATHVETLLFDAPDLTTTWSIVAVGTFDGYAAAWIRHTFPSTTYPSLCFLHVWDGLVFAPTFVQDPYLPGSFSPSIADLGDQIYSETFNPVMGLGASKLWTSTARGNAHCCRTADARVWNQRTNTSITTDGEHWCYVVPEGDLALRTYLVPRDASWLGLDARWAYYVLEYNDNGVWTPMEEVSGTPATAYQWSFTSVASRFAGGWNEIQINLRWGRASAGLIRLRMVAGATAVEVVGTAPTVSITAGSGTSWNVTVAAHTYRYRTADLQTAAAAVSNVPGSLATYLVSVAGGGFPQVLDISAGFPNGWQREHRHILKRLVIGAGTTGSTATNTPAWDTYPNQTGTVTVTLGSPAVVGVGTLFLTQIAPGDLIRVNSEDRLVLSVTDNLNLTTTTNYAASASGVTIAKKVINYARFTAGETEINTTLLTGVSVADTFRINSIDYRVFAVVGAGVYKIRDAAGIAGDFTLAVNALYTVTHAAPPVITDYEYAYEANDNSQWYTDRAVEAVDNAGAEDALSLATAAHDNTGGLITAIASLRQRMLITYSGSMQLWSIDQDTNRTAYLDTLSFGTGDQPTPPVIPWYSSLALPVSTGIRAISVVGANTDNLQDLNIGEPIADLQLDVSSAAQFWPVHGQLIFAQNHATTAEFLCLDYSRESKITAWSRWQVAGLTSVDPGTLIAQDSNLWFRSGTRLLRFDTTATTFRDYGDTVGAAYESAVTWHFNDMGKPGQGKRFVGMDIVQDGTCSVGFQLPPYGSWDTSGSGPSLIGPTIEGITYGRQRLPLAMVGPAIAPRITSRDERGWTLQRIALDFLLLRR